LSVIILFIFLVGEGAYAETGGKRKKRVYRTAIAAPVDSLDPAHAESVSELILLSNLVEPLLSINPKTGSLMPAAAKKYTVSQDGLVIQFTLRKDLYWSNGEKILAKDFVYSLRRLVQPSVESWIGEKLRLIRGVDEMAEEQIEA